MLGRSMVQGHFWTSLCLKYCWEVFHKQFYVAPAKQSAS